jgi:hypothetical protein
LTSIKIASPVWDPVNENGTKERRNIPVGLAQENSFGPAFLHTLLRQIKGRSKPKTCKKRRM